MTHDQLLDLWFRFRAGETLTADEDRELKNAFESDPALRDEILGDLRSDGILHVAGGKPTDAEDFARAFFNRLEAEGDASRFLKRVESRMDDQRRPRPETRRALAAPGLPAWKLCLIAAGVLVAIVLVIAVSSDSASEEAAHLRAVREAQRVQENRVREAAAQRARTEERLRDVQRQQEAITRVASTPAATPDEDARRKAEQQRLADIERELKAALAAAPKEQVPPTPPQEKPKDPKDPTPPTPAPQKQETVAAVPTTATLLYASGDVAVLDRDTRTPARSGQAILRGQGLVTTESAVAILLYPDGTRLSLGPGTEIRDLVDRSGKPGMGKRLTLARGRVDADVAKQPLDQPMVIATNPAEVKVLGTTLRVAIDPKQTGAMRLDVEEGRVQLKRLADLRTIDVITGHYAVVAAGAEMVSRPIAEVPLPFDRACPVIYINNGPGDCYSDEYLMALASAGDLKLRGIINSSDRDLEGVAAERSKVIADARRSGMRNIPDPVNGPVQPFDPPTSGKIEDTRPWGSPGGRLIVAEARKASPKKPLVVLSGGPLAAVADAYLLDPSIAERVVVIFHGGEVAGEVWNREWAAFIVSDRIRMVLTGPLTEPAKVLVTPDRLERLPESALREAMKAKRAPAEYSSLGIMGVMRTDFFRKSKLKSGMPWPAPGVGLGIVDDPKGRILLITEGDRAAAAEEFWRALEKPAAWGQQPK